LGKTDSKTSKGEIKHYGVNLKQFLGFAHDELRYILDPKDAYLPNFPGETFLGFKEKRMLILRNTGKVGGWEISIDEVS